MALCRITQRDCVKVLFIFLIPCVYILLWSQCSISYNTSKLSSFPHTEYLNLVPTTKESSLTNEEQNKSKLKRNYGANNDSCFKFAPDCMALIGSQYGSQPKLVSFHNHIPQRAEHPKTGLPFKVPNLVHFISFGSEQKFDFRTYITYTSVHKFLKPLAVILWADKLPNSTWWQKTVEEVANIYHIPTQPYEYISGKKVTYLAHASDFLRLELVRDFGGLYFDNDIIVLKTFDNIRVHEMTLSKETTFTIANGILVAAPQARFLTLWIESYGTYDPCKWGLNSVQTAHKLAAIFPHLLHLVNGSFTNPSWRHPEQMYAEHYNLTENYSIHMYRKDSFFIPANEKELAGYNCTLGDVMRSILYGRTDLKSNFTFNGIDGKWKKFKL